MKRTEGGSRGKPAPSGHVGLARAVPVLCWLHCPTSRRSFTGTVVSLGTSGSHSSEPVVPKGSEGRWEAAQGCQYKLPLLSSTRVCRSCPLLLSQSPAGAWLCSGQRCQVPAKSLGLPAASPGRWLERERQRCLPGLVSFVKAPAAGMSQDLLSPSERRRKGLCVQLPWAGLCGQQCPSVLPSPLRASWERSIEEWGEILAAAQRLLGLQRSGEGDTVLVWRLRR